MVCPVVEKAPMTDITTSIKKPSGFPSALLFLAGLLIGGGIATGIFVVVLHAQEERHQEQLAAISRATGVELVNLVGKDLPNLNKGGKEGDKKLSGDEAKILEIGKGLTQDLEKNRLTSVYRSTTPDYQRKNDRPMFDKMVERFPTLTELSQNEFERDYKVKKLPGNKGYEFYFTGQERFPPRRLVNFSFLFVQTGDEWLVDDVEITVNEKK
jgi:hypothetical protein